MKTPAFKPAFFSLVAASDDGSARGPRQATARQQMNMQMEHRLAAILIAIDHRPVAPLGDAHLPGVVGTGKQQPPQQLSSL